MLPNSNYVFYNKMQICREKQLFSPVNLHLVIEYIIGIWKH